MNIPERLQPLANVAEDLQDKDLEETLIFAAFLKYRRRVIDLAIKTVRPTQRGADAINLRRSRKPLGVYLQKKGVCGERLLCCF